MNWIAKHLPELLIVVGLLVLAVEILVLGFSTFVLAFVGLSAVVTGVLMSLSLFDATLLNAALAVAVLTLTFAVLLWQPLKRMQGQVENKPVSSDLVGYRFVLTDDIGPTQPGKFRYSGVDWKLMSLQSIPAGTQVEVVEVQVGQLYVRSKP